MTALSAIRAALVARVSAVPGAGPVHDRERYVSQVGAMAQLYSPAPNVRPIQLQGWFVRRTATMETADTVFTATVLHSWQIRGFRSLEDASASELVFDDLIEAVRAALQADRTLGGLIAGLARGPQLGAPLDGGVAVRDSGPVRFGDVLCHSADLVLHTVHFQRRS